jgi:signal transduction histidine kinase
MAGVGVSRAGWTSALLVCCAVVGLGTVSLLVSADAPTTYAAVSTAAATVAVLAGLLLVVAAAVRLSRGRGGACSLAALALGLVWWAPVWVGWEDGPALARSLAMLVVPFGPVLVLHLAAGLPGEVLASTRLRHVALAGYTVTAAYAVARAAVRDPFLDRYCWSNCSDNIFLVTARPALARALDTGWAAAACVLGGTAAAVAAGRLALTTPAGRRARWPLLLPLAVAGAATGLHGLLLMAWPPEDPADPRYLSTYVLTGLSLAWLGAGLGWLTLDHERRVRRLTHLATRDARGGDLAATLASTLGDPSVRVAYWLADPAGVGPEQAGRELVDRDGRRVEPGEQVAHLDIARGGDRVARVWFDPDVADRAALAEQVGPAAVLAVDNERLRAQMLVQLVSLRESRSRVVAAADEARRRLERDLHDGAQQRLLALALELRVAEGQASAAGDIDRARRLGQAGEQARAVVDELRTLAHGIYPAVLDQAGLDGALRALAESAHLPVTVEPAPVTDSMPPVVSRVLYRAAREAVRHASGVGADQVHLQVTRAAAAAVLRATPAFVPSTALADRVGAAGGTLMASADALTVEVPCA